MAGAAFAAGATKTGIATVAGATFDAGATKTGKTQRLKRVRAARAKSARAPDTYLVAVKPLGKMLILVLVFCCFGAVLGNSLPQDPFRRARVENGTERT